VRRLVKAGVDVLVVTQARAGHVDLGLYESGAALAEAGAISGGDLGLEAAVTKLMHALALWPREATKRREYLLRDAAGERT
jgi:L-asparaginase